MKWGTSVGLMFVALCLAMCGPAWASNATPAAATASTDFTPLFAGALQRINHYRSMVGLAPLSADPKLSEADRSHARYLVQNHVPGGDYDFGDFGSGGFGLRNYSVALHSEEPEKPLFSSAGANVAAHGIVLRAEQLPDNATRALDEIMSGGFDVLFVLNPQATAIGLGGYCAPGDCATVASYRMGLEKDAYGRLYHGQLQWNPALGPLPFTPARLKKPIEFPPPGSTVPIRECRSKFMSTLSKECPGYSPPTGPAIVLSLGAPAEEDKFVQLTDYSLTSNGNPLEACAVTGAKVEVPKQPSTKDEKVLAKWWADTAPARTSRQMLATFGAVIVLPRQPLEPGHTYEVSITAASEDYKWSFSVAAESSVAGVSK